MKQFLLFSLIALPSFLFAQPTITFNPANGATNVSLTANLIIDSNEALNLTDGTNLDDTNVDGRVVLVDGSSNPVPFDATVNGGRTTITVNPTGSLAELTTYTLTLLPVENNGGNETTPKVITFTTGDFTVPTITVAQAINNIGTGFTFRVNVNENATVHYVVDRDTSTPTELQIRTGNNGSGSSAEASGSFVVTGGVNGDEVITGLDFTPPVKFNIYFFAEDNGSPKNETAITTRGIPLLNSSSIPAASIAPDEFDLRVNVDEAVTTYYVVTQSSTPPTPAQILAGQNESGGTPDESGNFAVAGNTNTDENINGLDDFTTYYVHFVSTDGAGNQTIVETETATTTDGTPPVVVSRNPADDVTTVDIATNSFTVTFDENITTINSAASGNSQRIRLFENGIVVETIDRDDTILDGDGTVQANGASATATITFQHNFLPDMDYHILIGNDVFEDAAQNAFAGDLLATDWNFTTSTVAVNNATSNICSGSFQSIGNIIISETGIADFNNGAAQTLVLSLGNTSEFVISNSGVVASGLSADITSLSVSVGLTSITVTYTVAGGTVLDNITLSGLKVYATGVVASTTIIRTGGTADQDGNNGTGGSSLTHATINVGATPPDQPELDGTEDLVHCIGEDISAKTLTLVDQGVAVTYSWYSNPSLSTLVTSTTNETINIVSDLGLTSPAVSGTYKFYVVAVSACQSAPPVEVVIQVAPNPVADAGGDLVGLDAACPGSLLLLGGNPTLLTPSAPGAYTYSWEYLEGTPEPAPVANPSVTIDNTSGSLQTFNFEVTITDANGCIGVDTKTVEVKPEFAVSLTSPNSYVFSPNSPNQTLVASPPDGIFSGVGVVQSNAPSTYQFSPAIAHATDPNTLPKNFDIYYTATEDGCTQSNVLIATFTISNSFFATLQPEYCSSEYPNPNVNGVSLSIDATGYTYIDTRKTSWNTSERFSRGPYKTEWQAGFSYPNNSYVRYNNEIYQCNGGFLGLPCSGFTPPDAGGQWEFQNILKVKFNGHIANYYEDYYGGNPTPTIVKLGSTYTVGGNTYNFYRFGTNANYNYCAGCNYAYPAAYLEFERPEDIRLILPGWFVNYYYYRGDLVLFNGNVYQCTANPYTTGTQPDFNPGLWTVVTNTDYGNGQYFHKFDASIGAFRSGFYVNGQFVQINRNPTVFFNGLANDQDVCRFDVLNLDNPASSASNIYDLTGNFSNQNFVQDFSVRLDGAITFNTGSGTITNDILNPGKATFDTEKAFANSSGGAPNLKNIEIRYNVDPGTDGSAGTPCYGTSTLVVQVIENSTFDFDAPPAVDPEGSVYCYTEPSKNLCSVFGATVINGPAGSPNSVVYNGFGTKDLGNSQATFTPGTAIEESTPGTTIQQSIAVTALYRDANTCQSTRVRNFKVNPDIQPSFTFGGRVNYCYEDIANGFTGHFQDFTYNSGTVTSSGRYDFTYKDPGGTQHNLQTISTNNTSFTSQVYYDQIQTILNTNGFTGDVNQTVNLNVAYTESLNAGKVCSETFSQIMVINPPRLVDIFGLNDGDILCRNDNNNISQGNLVTFTGSETGSGIFKLDDDIDFSAINPTLNGTVNTTAGKATINLLTAYNAASDGTDPRQVFLQYQYTAPGCTGPADVIKGFEISPPPPLAFDFSAGNSPPNGEIFCFDEAPVNLRTIQNTNVTLSGWGITDPGTGTGVATFNPQLAFNTSVSNGGSLNAQQNIPVTARIVDGIGCANTSVIQYKVNPLPQASLDYDNNAEYCYEDAPQLLEGQQVKSWFAIEYQGVTTPYTENIGSITSPVSQTIFDPQVRFDHALTFGASTLTPVDFNVYYSVADADNCINTIGPITLSVANQIEVSIAGLDNNDIFCSNEDNGVKELSFNPFPSDATKRRFFIDGQPEALTVNRFNFTPGLAGGDYTLEYIVFSGENDCSNTVTTTVRVLPSPEAIFDVDPACNGALIDYDAQGNNNTSAMYTWTLSDSVRTGESIQHRFPGTNIYGVQLYVEYPAYNGDPNLVCKDSLRLDQIVGAIPGELNFKYFNVCEADPTEFEITPDIPISEVSWAFGDAVSTGFGFSANNIPGSVANTTGTYQEPIHTYAGEGNYTVTVTGKTPAVFGGCELTEVHNVAILKNWVPNPGETMYDMAQLDGGRGYWVEEDVNGNSSWDFSIANKQKRIQTSEMAWVTGATLPYNADDISYVNSPCFDLSTFNRPVLSIKHWTDTEPSDGAVLQYSVDGGKNWTRLGNVASGLDWYNRLTISSNPGEQTDLSSGWSLIDQTTWATGKHTLDVIPNPRTQVRFRVAFSSFNNREGRDGFAFNNVIIEERNRTILVENFTELAATVNNTNYKNFRAVGGVFNTSELVKLQYHHSSVQNDTPPDELHNDNPIDQNARAAFYGVTSPLRAFVDGGFGQTSSTATFMSGLALDTYFNLRSLVTSPVTIAIDFPTGPETTQLNIKATLQAVNDLGNSGNYNVFIAVAEREVMGQAYVLRKFLPHAAGTPLTSLSPTDPPQEIITSYDMRHVTRSQNGDFEPFAVIVFVQHLETKDVLQTALRQDATTSPEIVTGIETSLDNYIRVYPNPADAQLNIILPAPVKEETPVKLFDTFGKQVFSGVYKNGEDIKSLETKLFSAGVYLIQLSTPEGVVRKKAIVVHE